MDYVENWSKEFTELYPERRQLFICPKNECGTKKFVCTTIRPTELKHKEMYELDKCARLIADFVSFEPLTDPVRLPEQLYSPTFTVQTQMADAFDLSTLLASYLIGVGYDAYVVSGYAPRPVTLNDQTQTVCPLLEDAPATEEKKVSGIRDNQRYKMLIKPTFESKYMKQQEEEEKKKVENGDSKGSGGQKKEEEEEDPAAKDDPFYRQRIHSWILILPGKREVADHLFIEPATGVVYSVRKSPYLGIESVWNHSNYWVNMQSASMKELVYDLRDPEMWEYMFLDALAEGDRPAGMDEDPTAAPPAPIESNRTGVDQPEDVAAVNTAAVDIKIVEVPPSWVKKVEIDRNAYIQQYLDGSKVTDFFKSTLEDFAEYSREDGMLRRIIVYDDVLRSIQTEIRETFAHRKDKMCERRRYPKEGRTVEKFDPGHTANLQKIISVEGERREMHFYADARLDGLKSRIEVFGKKTVEEFEGRDDRLIYRSVTFDGKVKKGSDSTDLTIRKLTEKFTRNEGVDAEADVAKRTYLQNAGQIRIDYHYGPGRVTSSSRVYSKDGSSTLQQVDPFAPLPKKQQLLEDFRRSLLYEKECLQAVRESERDTKDIIAKRVAEESNIQLTLSIYDTFRKKNEEGGGRPEEQGLEYKSERDYLSPFLPDTAKAGKPLNREQALKTKDSCLKALKERLIERANIIQSRLDEENSALLKRQAAYQRSRDHIDKTDEEEYERYCQEAAFRIQILDARLKRHEELALQKYTEMDRKLREDTRLVVLLN